MARAASLAAANAKGATFVSPVQKKLSVGPARDRYETEADRIADRVMSGGTGVAPSAAPPISRLPSAAVQRAPVSQPNMAKSKEVKTTKVKDEKEEDNATVVQRSGDGPTAAPAHTEHNIGRMRAAGGRSLAAPVKSQMESGIGRSMSHVRVHDGAGPARAAKSVGARAFTVGNDVFFGAGQYRPETPSGAHLLAHELVHTEQQRGLGNLAQTTALQRVDTPSPPPARQENDDDDEGNTPNLEFVKPGDSGVKIILNEDGNGGTIHITHLQVPELKGGFKGASNHPLARGVPHSPEMILDPSRAYEYSGKTERKKTPVDEFQKQTYYTAAETELEPGLKTTLPQEVVGWADAPAVVNSSGEQRFYLRLSNIPARSTNTVIFGTLDELADHKRIKIPNWDRTGRPARFDVDHIQELQLGGLDGWTNFWLLDSSANQSSGRNINTSLRADISSVINLANTSNFWDGPNASRKPEFADFKDQGSNWKVIFGGFKDLAIDNESGPYWTRDEITGGVHLKQLTVLTEQELAEGGFIMDRDRLKRVSVFTSATGGHRKQFDVDGETVTPVGNARSFFGGFDLASITTNPDIDAAPMITSISGTMFRRRNKQPVNPTEMSGDNALKVVAGEGLGFSGYLDQGDFREKLSNIPKPQLANASPITFEDGGINQDGNIVATGYVTATKALFPAMNFPIYIVGNDIFVEFPIPTDKLNFGPVTVTEAALQIGVGEDGAFLSGNAALTVDQLGSGSVEARVDGANTIISGTFNFDLDFLDPAEANITYNFGEDTLTLSLTAGVGEGKLPGVKSGEITATFSRDEVAFGGTLLLGGALDGVVVSVTYSQAEGLSVGADNIQLPVENIPGVTSATASLHARQNPETREWSFGGQGTAALDIAGATGDITIGVDGDRVIFGGNLNVAKGPASGSLSFSATNAPVDEEGNPVDGEVTDQITVVGRGTAEITFGSVLKGTAGIELTPQANIIVSGTIGLPPTFEVFARQEYNKSLLKVETPDFPIWGVSVGGIGFGIFAFADAELSFNSFVGPGELVDTEIGAVMDLDRPEDAQITGSARFEVPAYAGLKLDIGGGLRARATVAFVEGRVGLEGELGIAAEGSAQVDVAWNRTDGLSVEAVAEAKAQPKFRVGVNASVRAGVDLGITDVTKTWGPWTKTLGEFGPEMEAGVKVPVKWNEQNGMDFSIDDIEITQPQINVKDILKSSFEELV
ncbi:MAG: eCIS core domain-containing protein [Sulfitobacter sp.]